MKNFNEFPAKIYWCPKCGNTDLIHNFDESDFEFLTVPVTIKCSNCGYLWEEEYTFSTTIIDQKPYNKYQKQS